MIAAGAHGERRGGATASRPPRGALRKPRRTDDIVEDAVLAALTSARRDGPDSDHLLIMDLHRAINRLAAETAAETVDGARAHGPATTRSPLRQGLHARPQSHPPSRVRPPGPRNYRRPTGRAAHDPERHRRPPTLTCWCIHVEGLSVAVTYTDVHRRRATLLHGAVREPGRRLDAAGRAARRRPGGRRRLLPGHRAVRGGGRGGAGRLPGLSSARASSS